MWSTFIRATSFQNIGELHALREVSPRLHRFPGWWLGVFESDQFHLSSGDRYP